MEKQAAEPSVNKTLTELKLGTYTRPIYLELVPVQRTQEPLIHAPL